QEQSLLCRAEHLTLSAPLAGHFQARQRVRLKQSLVNRPVKNVAQDAEVPVDGGVLERKVPAICLAFLPKFLGHRLGQSQHENVGEKRQQELEVIQVVVMSDAAGNEARGEFAEL